MQKVNLLILRSLSSETASLRLASFAVSALFILPFFVPFSLLVLLCFSLSSFPIALFLFLKL